jgi:hypothetical protein
MDPKDLNDEPGKTSPSSDDEPTGEMEQHKHRKHGYRGYPNNPNIGGDIHTGSGFAGIGSTAPGASGSDILTDKTREAIEELEDEDDTQS